MIKMQLSPRQQTTPDNGSGHKTIVIVLVVVITILILSILSALWFFNRRAKSRKNGKHTSWRQSLQSITSSLSHRMPVRSDVLQPAGDVESNNAGVDRNTSVRSVMTLPAYSAVPRDNEGVIGREGERAGMDTVVEYPETNHEEEARREEEMASLYQIRLARRREVQEREDRRRRRRAARERGDEESLAAIRMESRRARRERERTGSTALVGEHESRPRERRVSAVSYGNLGVARHDGSRVRANSEDSERPLLEMTEPMRPWVSRESSSSHRRGSSSFTNPSLRSYNSEDDSGWSDADSNFETISLHPTRSRAHSRSRATSTTSRSGTIAADTSRATSQGRNTSLAINTDVQNVAPSTSSTLDVEPPPYTSPVHTRGLSEPITSAAPQAPPPAVRPVSEAPSLPEIERLPSIRVISDTPVDPVPGHKRSFTNFSLRRDSRILNLEDLE